MAKLEKIMNRRIVRSLFNHYSTRGRARIEELFGADRERTLRAFLGRIPVNAALGLGMKKIGVNEDLRKMFFAQKHNRQTVLNVMKTIAGNGLRHPFRFDAPLVIVWNYTNVCNLHCRYCYQSAGRPAPDELSFEEKIDLINQMVDANVAFVAFSGGEPVMGPRFWDVLNYASRFLHTSIASNGTLLANNDYVERLADNGARNVFASLDGARASSHDDIRGEGNFKKSMAGIKNLVNNEHLHVGVNMVVTRSNYHEVEEVMELAIELGVNSFSHYNFIPTGRGSEDKALDLTPRQREDLMDLLCDYHFRRKETGLNIVSTSPTFARALYERSEGRNAGLFHYTADHANEIGGIIEYAGGCGAGRVYGAVQPNGFMSPCVFMPGVIIGDLREERFIDIWRNSEVCKKLCDRDNFHFECPKYRTICGGCRARAYAYGDLVGPDPGCIYQELSGCDHEWDESEEEREMAVSIA